MQVTDIPTKIPIFWAQNAGGAYVRPIPNVSQIGTNPGFASFPDGFVPLNMTDESAGGIPPFGQDMNGAMRQITQWLRWSQAGGTVGFDNSFSAQVAGYPSGSILAASAPGADAWISTVDNNVTNPDTGGDNWTTTGRAVTGDMKFRLDGGAQPGWVKANGSTIGAAGSAATQLAANVAAALYSYFWTNFSNSQCPVTGGRGASSAADFAALKPLAVYDMRGIGVQGVDTMGGGATTRLSGVPVTSGNATTPGSLLGENLHSLVSGENGPHAHGTTENPHTHTYTSPGGNAAPSGSAVQASTSAGTTGATSTGLTVNSAGSGTAHNTVQLSAVGTWYFKT